MEWILSSWAQQLQVIQLGKTQPEVKQEEWCAVVVALGDTVEESASECVG